MSRLTLLEAVELTALIASKDPRRHGRAAARWLRRFLEQRPEAAIEEAALAAAALQALGGRHHEHALSALRAIAETASGPSAGRA
jgi:NAD(P)H-dependent FMN reductase